MSTLPPVERRMMARATRTFDDRTENVWYYIDPEDVREKALLAGGYMELQESLFEVSPRMRKALDVMVATRKGNRRGKVEAEPGGDDAGGTA